MTGTYTTGVTCADSPATVGPGIGSGTVTPTVSGATTNFTVTSVNGSWSITAATPTLRLTCTAVTYNGAAHTCAGTATGVGGATVAGTWAFNPASETNAGTYTVTGTFTSTNGNYVSGGTATGTLTINPAPVTATAGSYNGVYNAATHAPSACAVTGTYTTGVTCADNPATVGPGVGTGTVTPTVSGATTNFTVTTVNGSWSITKATPTVTTLPTASAITYGQTLSSSTLTGGTASVAGTFSWTTPATAPPVGTDSESVTFTPNDTTDYNTVTGSVTVTVRQGDTNGDGVADSRRHHLRPDSVLVDLTGGTASVAGTFSWTTPATVPARVRTSESVTFTPTNTADYNTVTGTVTVTVNKATPTVTAPPTAGAITYGQTLASST